MNKSLNILIIIISLFIASCKGNDGLEPEPCTSAILIDESFENYLDSRITIISKNIENILPGISDTNLFGSPKAFRFGKSFCKANCYNHIMDLYIQPYSTYLHIVLPQKERITSISFKTAEIGNDWGSVGQIFLDSVNFNLGNEHNDFGHFFNSCLKKDETVKYLKYEINKDVKTIDIAVWDICNGSEIFIDDLKIEYCKK